MLYVMLQSEVTKLEAGVISRFFLKELLMKKTVGQMLKEHGPMRRQDIATRIHVHVIGGLDLGNYVQ